MRLFRPIIAAATIGIATLWLVPANADNVPGVMPGDEAMSCEQIGMELAPYARQMMPNVRALNEINQELVARGKARIAAEMPVVIGMTAAATAASADPTGIASKAVSQAEVAHQQQVWMQAEAEDKPLADKAKQQADTVAAQGMQMQANARIQRLMQLARQKHCH